MHPQAVIIGDKQRESGTFFFARIDVGLYSSGRLSELKNSIKCLSPMQTINPSIEEMRSSPTWWLVNSREMKARILERVKNLQTAEGGGAL